MLLTICFIRKSQNYKLKILFEKFFFVKMNNIKILNYDFLHLKIYIIIKQIQHIFSIFLNNIFII